MARPVRGGNAKENALFNRAAGWLLSVVSSVEAADSIGSASLFECFVPADSKMPAPHSHDAFEETIYGLEGTTTWTVDGGRSTFAPAKPSA
jgi:hypothetical protein